MFAEFNLNTPLVAGAAIRNFRIGPSLSNRIESGRPIRIQIESRNFTGSYPKPKNTIYMHTVPITGIISYS